jgi:hypothetical protein
MIFINRPNDSHRGESPLSVECSSSEDEKVVETVNENKSLKIKDQIKQKLKNAHLKLKRKDHKRRT